MYLSRQKLTWYTTTQTPLVIIFNTAQKWLHKTANHFYEDVSNTAAECGTNSTDVYRALCYFESSASEIIKQVFFECGSNLRPMMNIWCQHLQSSYDSIVKKLAAWLSEATQFCKLRLHIQMTVEKSKFQRFSVPDFGGQKFHKNFVVEVVEFQVNSAVTRKQETWPEPDQMIPSPHVLCTRQVDLKAILE